MQTSIEFIHHDCFLVTTPRLSMVFDYWTDPGSQDPDNPDFLQSLDPRLPLYVFVSHSHKDHFNRCIFGWASRFPKIRYLLSRETWKKCRHILSPSSVYNGPKIDPDLAVPFSAGETWDDGILEVRAFGSTDIGVSWLAETERTRFFHAGDFNAWIWRDESTPGEIREALGRFHAILDTIAASLAGQTLHYAFFPVDSRIGSGYHEGAFEFVRRIRVETFLPMHFGLGDRDEQLRRRTDAFDFGRYALPGQGRYIGLGSRGDRLLSHTS